MTVPDPSITFALQGVARDRVQWLDLARQAEAAGFTRLLVPDHPGSTAAPFVALAAAAAVTETIGLGTYVVNAGAWEPMLLASQVATLDRLSAGRAVFGIGAGHTPREWTDRGLAYPSAAERVDRMIDLATQTRDWLTRLDAPQPIQSPVPMLVGGNGRRVLAYAAEHADIIGLTGLGRTLDDGHNHDVEWSRAQIDERIGGLARPGRAPILDSLVQFVVVTDDRDAALAELAAEHDLIAQDLLDCPYVLVGSPAQIAMELLEHRDRWGITSYTVRPPAIDAVAAIRAELVTRS